MKGTLRLTALGTGVPRVSRSQFCTSYLVQLGDAPKRSFLFDIGDVRWPLVDCWLTALTLTLTV
jgi:hypothetical protein